MARFSEMNDLVSWIEKKNTPDYDEDDAHLANLTDEKFYTLKAIGKTKALEKFGKYKGFSDARVAEIYRQAVDFGFLRSELVDSPGAPAERILVTFKGRELTRRILWLKVGQFIAWLEYRNKVILIFAGFIGGGLFGNLDSLIEFISKK